MASEQPYRSETIRDALLAIQRRELVLPAIQREFIWHGEQVCRLFDSLLRGYPFGTFLYWTVEPEHVRDFKWYDFIREWHEKKIRHNESVTPFAGMPLTAVLDGQQRLTALNVGLRGSMAWKLRHTWWKFDENFPTRRLYLNLIEQQDEDIETQRQFDFLREDLDPPPPDRGQWFNVSDIMDMRGKESIPARLEGRDLPDYDYAHSAIGKLYDLVHTEPLILAYEEKGQEADRVLQIFNRLNRGGTPLSYSDLLLSVIVSQLEEKRDEILGFVDDLNDVGSGFSFSKDFVLKAALMLLDLNVAFKAANFKKENADKIGKEWSGIKQTLRLTAELASSFGLGRDNLRTNNALLPIAYYLRLIGAGDNFLRSRHHAHDRAIIRAWLFRSLLKRSFWSRGGDSLLTTLRTVIRDNQGQEFPVDPIEEKMVERERPLTFTPEEVDGLAETSFGDPRIFLLLSLLFPVDLTEQLHVDHIFPAAAFTEEYAAYYDKMNQLPNLQLLNELENKEKLAKLPLRWLDEKDFSMLGGRKEYTARRLLDRVPADLSGFEKFYDYRLAGLRKRIVELLGASE